jgi:hypothetical protein
MTMSQCKTCAHPRREEIDRALIEGRSRRALARDYGLAEASVRNHARVHLPDALSRAKEAADAAAAADLLRQARDIQACTLEALKVSRDSGDTRAMLAAVREARGNLALLSRVLAGAAPDAAASVLLSPEWLRTRSAILDALTPYPDARLAVAARLAALQDLPASDSQPADPHPPLSALSPQRFL